MKSTLPYIIVATTLIALAVIAVGHWQPMHAG